MKFTKYFISSLILPLTISSLIPLTANAAKVPSQKVSVHKIAKSSQITWHQGAPKLAIGKWRSSWYRSTPTLYSPSSSLTKQELLIDGRGFDMSYMTTDKSFNPLNANNGLGLNSGSKYRILGNGWYQLMTTFPNKQTRTLNFKINAKGNTLTVSLVGSKTLSRDTTFYLISRNPLSIK